jgi:chorismate mutase
MANVELKRIAAKLHSELTAAGIKVIGVYQLRDFGEIPETEAGKIIQLWVKAGWKRSPDDQAKLVVPSITTKRRATTGTPERWERLARTAACIALEHYNSGDWDKDETSIITAAIKTCPMVPMEEAQIAAFVDRAREMWLKKAQSILESRGLAPDIIKPIMEELRRVSADITEIS